MIRQCLISLLLFTSLFAEGTPPNLIPEKPSHDPNYWCTWYAQNYWIGRGTDLKTLQGVTNKAAREQLNEKNLFNPKDGWATTLLKRGRKDLTFLIDHGWQDKNKKNLLPGATPFFSLQMDFADLPRYKGKDYGESLRLFNNDIKAQGWRDLGLWTRGDISEKAAKRMVNWSKHAGITYWKIDGGGTKHFYSYKIKEKIYPELQLEYICGASGPLNPNWQDANRKEYPSVFAAGASKQKISQRIMQNTDVFRTYDVAPLMFSITTMRRVSDILSQTQGLSQYIAKLNIQDDPQVAAGLGCLIASKRHPNYMERTYKGKDLHHQLSGERRIQKRMNAIERFTSWSRIAHAFPAGVGSFRRSEQELVSHIKHTEYDTWFKPVYGKMVYQSAPAIMSRNMPLPTVEPMAYPPHVMATTYPNGCTAIATEGRVSPEKPWSEPRAKITVQIKDASKVIGVFGRYDTLTLKFAGALDGVKHIWAQDLIAKEATDILSQVQISGNTLTLDGALIDALGTAAGDQGDNSVPGLVLKLDGESLPDAGNSFFPEAKPETTSATTKKSSELIDGFRGTASLKKTQDRYLVSAQPGKVAFALKKLENEINSGKATFTWTMEPANNNATRNGFLTLSSGDDGQNAIFAGAFIASNHISAFEQTAQWGKHAKTKPFKPSQKLNCKAVLDMDARTLTVTINGVTQSVTFSEAVTTIDHIGFTVKGAETYFTTPQVTP